MNPQYNSEEQYQALCLEKALNLYGLYKQGFEENKKGIL